MHLQSDADFEKLGTLHTEVTISIMRIDDMGDDSQMSMNGDQMEDEEEEDTEDTDDDEEMM